MSDLIVLPYAARLQVGFLLEHLDDALAEAGYDFEVGNNIGTDATPATFPFIRVSQLGGSIISGGSIHWLSQTLTQIDVWGPGGNDRYAAHVIAQVAASLLAQRLSGAVEVTIGAVPERAAVSVCTVGVVIDDTDTALTPPRPYSRFDTAITAHPLPSSGS